MKPHQLLAVALLALTVFSFLASSQSPSSSSDAEPQVFSQAPARDYSPPVFAAASPPSQSNPSFDAQPQASSQAPAPDSPSPQSDVQPASGIDSQPSNEPGQGASNAMASRLQEPNQEIPQAPAAAGAAGQANQAPQPPLPPIPMVCCAANQVDANRQCGLPLDNCQGNVLVHRLPVCVSMCTPGARCAVSQSSSHCRYGCRVNPNTGVPGCCTRLERCVPTCGDGICDPGEGGPQGTCVEDCRECQRDADCGASGNVCANGQVDFVQYRCVNNLCQKSVQPGSHRNCHYGCGVNPAFCRISPSNCVGCCPIGGCAPARPGGQGGGGIGGGQGGGGARQPGEQAGPPNQGRKGDFLSDFARGFSRALDDLVKSLLDFISGK